MAAETARKESPNSEIILFDEESFSYKRSALPSLIAGSLRLQDIMIYPSESLYRKNIQINTNSRIINLEAENHSLKYVNSQNSIKSEKYDKLILTTGGQAIKPQVEGVNKAGVFTFRNIHDAMEIKKWAENSVSATVVGAGFIGLLATEALSQKGLKVTLVEKESRILWTILEEDFSDVIHNIMRKQDIQILTNTSVERIMGDHRVRLIETNRDRFHTDLIVFTIGIKPRIKLAQLANASIGNFGITVNDKMQTSLENIYAAGDCVEVTDFITKKRVYLPLGSLASEEGVIAGSNAVGSLLKSHGFLRAQDEELFNQHIVSIGHTISSAQSSNIKAREIQITPIHFSESRSGIQIKLIVDTNDNLIGAQLYTSKYNFIARSYPPILLHFIKENVELPEVFEYLKRPYRKLPEFLLWKTGIIGAKNISLTKPGREF